MNMKSTHILVTEKNTHTKCIWFSSAILCHHLEVGVA